MNNADADAFDPIPKTAAQVARRSLVLSTVVCRCSLESGAADPDAKAVHLRVLNWLTSLNLWDEAEPSEVAVLGAPSGALDDGVVLRSGWYVEGLAILAWALGLTSFPKYDEQVDVYAVADAVCFLGEEADVIANAKLRDASELDACRELLYAIHVRLREYARDQIPNSFTPWIEKSWLDALGYAFTDLTAQDDLAIDGKPISQTKEERMREVLSIIHERHRASIWLMGEQPNYSEITVDT